MNTDDGFTVEFKQVTWSVKKRELVYKLLEGTEKTSIEEFMIAAQNAVSIYNAHRKSHDTIPDAKEQKRYLTKLRNKTTRLKELALDVSDLLNDAPYELRGHASIANIPVHSVQTKLVKMLQAINDVTPQKSKYRPEVILMIISIAKSFEEHIGSEPIACAFREDDDVPAKAPPAKRFVPILAELLNLSIDQAYRLARYVLPS